MKKLFLDTNIWLRFILKDEEKQYSYVYNLLSQIEEGIFRVYISNIVLLEIYFVLLQLYKISQKDVLLYISNILKVRGITLIEKTNSIKAIQYCTKYNIKFADCLIASQISNEMLLVTYDDEFKKIREIKCITPDKILD